MAFLSFREPFLSAEQRSELKAAVERNPTDSAPFSSLQEQFEFALTAVAEEVNAILRALPQ